MSDNRINPASADRKNPYADLGPRDPQAANTPPGANTVTASPPVSAPPIAGAYPNPLAQAPSQGPNPWVTPPSYPPQVTQVNPWASPAPTKARKPAVPQPLTPQYAASAPQWNQDPAQPMQSAQPMQLVQRPKRRWVMALVVGIIALLIGFAMGESSAKQEARAQIDDLWAENYDLRNELDDRDSQIEALRQQLQGETGSSSSPPQASPADPYSLDPWWDFGSNAAGTEGFPGDGVYMVGFSIEAGTYATGGREGCLWTRVTGDYSIEDVSGIGETATEVVIDPSDLAFMTSGCEDWVRVG